MKSESKKVRVRFAPSPTGEVHIGSARTALFNYLFAKHNNGKIILRIEDTDQKRFVAGAVERLIKAMEWLGMTFDEGPQLLKRVVENPNTKIQISNKIQNLNSKIENYKPCLPAGRLKTENLCSYGTYGPYIQSERLGIYQEYAQKLVEDGHAYYCFCSEDRLKDMREKQIKSKQAPMYDRKCLNLSVTEKQKNIKTKKPYVMRLKVPEGGKTVFTDLIRGYVEFDNVNLDDQVLIKSDGMPTYHLANVVDDHLMNITHVLRAEEWLPSTPKHIILYDAFGWEIPEFGHISLVLAPDKSKLSKRHGATSIEEFRECGYLPEALVNYISLLGWNPKDNREFFNLQELIKEFEITKVNKAGGIFDLDKLDYFNKYYLHNKTVDEVYDLIMQNPPPMTKKEIILNKRIITVIKERMVKLNDFEELVKPFVPNKKYSPDLLIFKKSTKQSTLKGLSLIAYRLSQISELDWESIEKLNQNLLDVVEENNLTNGDVFWPVRVALSGLEKSPSPIEMLWVLGKKESLIRLQKGIKILS